MRRARFVAGVALASTAMPCRILAEASAPVLRIGTGGADTFAEPYYAMELGFFKKAGLNVELTTFASGAQIATAVAGGALDAGISNTVNLAGAIAHGAPFVLIAGAGMYSSKLPTTVLMTAKNSPLRAAKDLEGKTVAVTALKDLTEVGTRAWLERNGADVAKVKFVEIPMPQMPANLERGTVDAAVVGEPWLSPNRDKTLRVFAPFYDAVGPQFLIADWFTTVDFARKQPALIKRLVDVVYETARWANAQHDESGAILAKWGKLDPAGVAAMGRCEYATNLDPKLIEPMLGLMYTYDALDRKLTLADLTLH